MNKTQRHADLCLELHETYKAKNTAYGDSFSRTWDEYGIVSALVRISDKWQRINALAKGVENQVTDESILDTLKDLANYALMSVMEIERRKGGDAE